MLLCTSYIDKQIDLGSQRLVKKWRKVPKVVGDGNQKDK